MLMLLWLHWAALEVRAVCTPWIRAIALMLFATSVLVRHAASYD
jgi:hypothetical protein